MEQHCYMEGGGWGLERDGGRDRLVPQRNAGPQDEMPEAVGVSQRLLDP